MDFQHSPPLNNLCPSGSPCIKIACVPYGSTLKIYTMTLALVRAYGPADIEPYPLNLGNGVIYWDGNNGEGNPVAAGLYYYVLEAPNGRTFGKFAISRSRNGS